MKLLPAIATLVLLVLTRSAYASEPDLGRNLAATCANCHGTNGHAVAGTGAGMDSLAGVEKARTLQKLHQYKNGERAATIMHQITKGYTDTQLDLIATYFAAQK